MLEVQAAPERFADEPIAARRMVERLRDRHEATPGVLTGDKAYGSGPFLAWLEEREIEGHVPLIDRRHQTGGMLTQDAFVYDEASDTYTCPQGAVLKRYGSNEDVQRYRASQRDCGECPIKASCTTGKMRALCRSPHEAVRERVRARQGTPAVRRSMRLRKAVEHLFGHVKHHDGLRRLRLRGLRGADEQFVLAADGAKPQAHGPVGRPPALAGRDAGVGNPPGRGVQARGRRGAACTNLPSADGNGAPRRATPSLFQQSRSVLARRN